VGVGVWFKQSIKPILQLLSRLNACAPNDRCLLWISSGMGLALLLSGGLFDQPAQ